MGLFVLLSACSLFGIDFDGDPESDTGAVVAVDTGTAPQCWSATPEVKIGTGEFALVPLADGDEVTLNHGVEGGWHVWAGAAVTGVARVVDVASTLTTVSDGVIVGDSHLLLDLSQLQGYGAYDRRACAGTFFHVYALLAVDGSFPFIDQICALEGQPIEMTLTVTSYATSDPSAPRDTGYPAGYTAVGTASDSAAIVLHIDPIDEDYCQAIQ